MYKAKVTSALCFQDTNMTHQFLFCSRFRHRKLRIRKEVFLPISWWPTTYSSIHALCNFIETKLVISASAALSLIDSNEKKGDQLKKKYFKKASYSFSQVREGKSHRCLAILSFIFKISAITLIIVR